MKLASTILFIVCSLSAAQAQSFKSYTDLDGLPSKNVLSLASDGNGTMWFGTQKGIAIFDGNTWEVMNTTTHPVLANDNVSSILITSSGDVWIGGDYGVSKYSGSTSASRVFTNSVVSSYPYIPTTRYENRRYIIISQNGMCSSIHHLPRIAIKNGYALLSAKPHSTIAITG